MICRLLGKCLDKKLKKYLRKLELPTTKLQLNLIKVHKKHLINLLIAF